MQSSTPSDNHTPEQSFAATMKAVRERRGITQTELAAHLSNMGLEIDGTAVTRIERGDRRIRLNEAVGITTVLGIDLYEAIALHPGSLQDQIDRAEEALRSALWARDYWAAEAETNTSRLRDLKRSRGRDG